MVIIDNKIDEITVKIPNNLVKSGNPVLYLRNTETKVEYDVEVDDTGESGLFYVFNYVWDGIPVGEYEYDIDGNLGLLRIEDRMPRKVYDEEITFKAYEA